MLKSVVADFYVWIDQTGDHLARAIADDDRRWSQTTYQTFETDQRKRWLAARIAWMDEQIYAPTSPVPALVTENI